MAAADGDDSLYPIAVLIDELRNEDVQVRRPLGTRARQERGPGACLVARGGPGPRWLAGRGAARGRAAVPESPLATGRAQKGPPLGRDWGSLSSFWVSVAGRRCCGANTLDGH